jgi:hypothetical protein
MWHDNAAGHVANVGEITPDALDELLHRILAQTRLGASRNVMRRVCCEVAIVMERLDSPKARQEQCGGSV